MRKFWDLNSNTSQTLLLMSQWTHGRGAETTLLIAAQARDLSGFQLLFSHSLLHCL